MQVAGLGRGGWRVVFFFFFSDVSMFFVFLVFLLTLFFFVNCFGMDLAFEVL